jgi:arginine decarboxylase
MTLHSTFAGLGPPPVGGLPKRTIAVTSAIGNGPTDVAAFDAALRNAGIGNFNLVQLSSVIPPGSTILDLSDAPVTVDGEWGDRLYVVMARSNAQRVGDQVWAGIGWIQEEHSRKGLFVEQAGGDELGVRSDIVATLDSMARHRCAEFNSMDYHVRGAACSGTPVCALVVAIFERQAWSTEWSPPSGLQAREIAAPDDQPGAASP